MTPLLRFFNRVAIIAVSVSVNSWAGDSTAQTAYRLIPQTVYEKQPVKYSRWMDETVYEKQNVTSYKPVWNTEQRERKTTVLKPVKKTSMREERQVVQKPITETKYRVRNGDRNAGRDAHRSETRDRDPDA